MGEVEIRRKAYHELLRVDVPYVPGGQRYFVTHDEAASILNGFFGLDGVFREGCEVIDTVPMLFMRYGDIYTASHIVSVVREEIMDAAASVALSDLEHMKAFIDYVWFTIGSPPSYWAYDDVYRRCIITLYETKN
jgi:hypothetical protein